MRSSFTIAQQVVWLSAQQTHRCSVVDWLRHWLERSSRRKSSNSVTDDGGHHSVSRFVKHLAPFGIRPSHGHWKDALSNAHKAASRAYERAQTPSRHTQ